MPRLYLGQDRNVEPSEGGCLYIGEEVLDVPHTMRPKVFDPMVHGFNPLNGIDHKRARGIANILYTVSPQGESTLTVRNGKRELLKGLLNAKRLDKVKGGDEMEGLLDELFVSPVLRQVLCERNDFNFSPRSTIFVRVSREELGDFDALVIVLLLMSYYKGHIIVQDFGFYGRELHLNLISQGRLTVGVNFLGELSPKLRNGVLLIKDKVVSGATVDDAKEMAQWAGLYPDPSREDNDYNKFIREATGESAVTVQ